MNKIILCVFILFLLASGCGGGSNPIDTVKWCFKN
jgi:hypothetical protein